MSVAEGSEALDAALPGRSGAQEWSPPEPPVEPPVEPPAEPPGADRPAAVPSARSTLPPRPPVPSGPVAWARALRAASLPTTLLGGAAGGLLVVWDPATRPELLALGLLGLVVGHGLVGLARDLGDARPGRAGPLRRVEAGRALLVLAAIGALVVGVLVAVHDLRAAPLVGVGLLAGLLAVSRRSGAVLSALAGLAGGTVALGLTIWSATGALPQSVLLAGLAVGGAVAGLLAARRAVVTGAVARVLVLLPYAAVGGGVATGALPWPTLAVGLALPAARRASSAALHGDAAQVVAGHARLLALLLVTGLLAAAVTGTDLPLG